MWLILSIPTGGAVKGGDRIQHFRRIEDGTSVLNSVQ